MDCIMAMGHFLICFIDCILAPHIKLGCKVAPHSKLDCRVTPFKYVVVDVEIGVDSEILLEFYCLQHVGCLVSLSCTYESPYNF